MTLNLGRNGSNTAADYVERIDDLERTVQRIPARAGLSTPSLSRIVTQTAHGFAFGDVIARGASSWASANLSGTWEPIGLVIRVLNANTFEVALRGYFYAPGLVPHGEASAVSDWTTYYLNPANLPYFASEAAVLAVVPSTGVALRGVFTTLDRGWIEVHGPKTEAHDHPLEYARNVLRPLAGFSLGQVLTYDPNAFGASVPGWKATSAPALSTLSALSVFGNATTLAAVGAAIGPAPANAVFICNAAGTAIGWGQVATAGLADGSVTATKIGTDVYLETLKDVSITTTPSDTRTQYDYLYWTGSAWSNRNLGPMVTGAATGGDKVLALDGGFTGGLAMTIGLGHVGSRFYVGNAGTTALDFKMSGSAVTNDDLCLRMLADSTGVKFYDQARGLADGSSTGASAGTEVMEWGGNSTASSRYFRFGLDVQFADTGTFASANLLKIHAQGTKLWRVLDSSGNTYLDFNGNVGGLPNNSVKLLTALDLAQQNIYMDIAGSGTSVGILWTNASSTLSVAASKVVVGTTLGSFAMFGGTPNAKYSVSAPSAIVTTETAGASYTATEQSMLGHLKTDVTNLRNALNEIWTALSTKYNMV